LEQSIDFIKEIQYILSCRTSNNIPTLDNVIKEFNHPTFDHPNSNLGLGLVTKILHSSLEYDYLSCTVDLFVINNNSEIEPREYREKQSLLPLDVLSQINYKLINFLNTREQNEQIAFVYDYSSKTFDVIINYDSKGYIKNIINFALAGVTEYCKNNNWPQNQSDALISHIQRLEEKIIDYEEQFATIL